jgi:hypothetical protein
MRAIGASRAFRRDAQMNASYFGDPICYLGARCAARETAQAVFYTEAESDTFRSHRAGHGEAELQLCFATKC